MRAYHLSHYPTSKAGAPYGRLFLLPIFLILFVPLSPALVVEAEIEYSWTAYDNLAHEAPTALALSNSEVDENEPAGTVVGTFTTSDPDAGETHSYTLVAGAGDNDNASFTIDGDELRTAEAFDFEMQDSYSIRVRSTDDGGLWLEVVFTITVNDVNEAPAALHFYDDYNEVLENSPHGHLINVFTTSDPDAGDSHVYALVAGVGDEGNAFFEIAGNQLLVAADIDFETDGSSLSIRVRVTDRGGLWLEEQFTITVLDEPEPPTALALSNDEVFENSAVGTMVGFFSTEDPDIGDTHNYTLVAGAGDEGNASFTIDDDKLRTAELFDFETQDNYSIRVRSTDRGGLGYWIDEIFTINVLSETANQAPVANAGPDQLTEVNQVVTLDGSGSSDFDGDLPLSYHWTQTAGRSVILDGARTATPSFTAPARYTTLIFTLTVTDARGLKGPTDSVVVIVQEAAITIAKVADVTAANPGNTVTYSYTISNSGDLPLSGVMAEDDMLGELFEAPIELAVDEVVTATLTYTVVEDDLPGPLVNVATVSGASPMGNEVRDSDFAIVTLSSQAAIVVFKEANTSSAAIGQEITYTYTVVNAGDVTLSDVTAVDDRLGPVPLGASALTAGQSTTGALSYTVTELDLPGPLLNTVVASGLPPAGPPVTDEATVSLPIVTRPQMEVVLEVSAEPARPGERVSYTLTTTNSGDVTLNNLTSVVSVGDGFELPDALAPGAAVTASYSYTVRAGDLPGPLANEVVVTALSPTGDELSETATATTVLISSPNLYLPFFSH